MKKQIRSSFIKPILPGFTDSIKIPPFFFKYCLHGRSGEARLTRGGREWTVKITVDGIIADGWTRFATENGLAVGDIVKIERVKKMVFVALVFDAATGCGKAVRKEEEAGGNKGKEIPCFSLFMKAYNIEHKCLMIPMSFAGANGLSEKREMVLTDNRGRRREAVSLKRLEDGDRFRIDYGGGSSKIFRGFKEGDLIKFEVLETGVLPLARVSRLSI